MDRSFSIFQDNKDRGAVPYMKQHFILNFTTACHDQWDEYSYSYTEVASAAEDLNNGAADGSRFYLLPTQCYDKSLSEGLTDYFESIYYILNYG